MSDPPRLRIAYLSAGTLTHIIPYIQHFRDLGHDVHWITLDKPNVDMGVPVYDISHGARANVDRTHWRYLLAVPSLRRILRSIQPHFLHGFYVTSTGTLAYLSGFQPYVLSVQGSDLIASIKSRIWRTVLHRVFAKCALVHTVSDQLTNLVKDLQIDEKKTLTLTQGVDTEQFPFRPSPKMVEPIKLLCCRTLGTVYNPETIVDACAILKHNNLKFRLTFAAGGPLQGKIEAQAGRLGMQNEIRFLGGYTNEKLPALLQEHDVYVSASFWDGTSVSLLEAMSSGLFPIVSRIPANQSWVADGKTALLFDCGDPRQLAAQIQVAMATPELVATAVRENRSRVIRFGNRQANMESLELVYGRFGPKLFAENTFC